jgi:hypothetical protein
MLEKGSVSTGPFFTSGSLTRGPESAESSAP